MTKTSHRKRVRKAHRRITKNSDVLSTRRGINSSNYGDGIRKGQLGVDQEEIRYKTFKEQGKRLVHYCPDWDFMAIHSEMPEMEACLCSLQ